MISCPVLPLPNLFLLLLVLIFSTNLYVYEGLIALFSISNTWHFFHIKFHFPCLATFIYLVAPHNPCGFLSFLVILHHLQTDLCNCLLLLSYNLHILITLLVPKLIPVVLHFLFLSILIFHFILLFNFFHPVLYCSFNPPMCSNFHSNLLCLTSSNKYMQSAHPSFSYVISITLE